MKNCKVLIFAIILSWPLSSKLAGQDIKGKYFPVPGLDKFVGTWESKEADKDFQIVLIKKKVLIEPFKAYTDHIEGFYIYKGKKSIDPAIKIGMMPTDYENKVRTNALYFQIIDKDLGKQGQGFLILDSGSENACTLRITNTEGMRTDKYNLSFSMPTEIKMQKLR